MLKKLFITFIFLTLGSCGTIYVPQMLPEGRGISKSEGQQKIDVEVIPLTSSIVKKANEDDYIRRVVDAGDLNRAARLISVDQAINEKIPPNENPGPYKLGIGDKINISQILPVQKDDVFNEQIVQRELFIADDGFISVLGIGRLPLSGLTQVEAEDLLYERLVLAEIRPEFELNITDFNSKKIYITNNLIVPNAEKTTTSIFEIPYTNYPVYLNQILDNAKLILSEGLDALIEIKRDKKKYRVSARKVLEGDYNKIRMFPEDHVIIRSIPYRPETATLIGEVFEPRIIELSPSNRITLSEAMYSKKTFNPVTSDTSQIYILRPKTEKNIKAYHLNASNPTRLILAAKFELRPMDIIYISPQPISNYSRALIQIFGALAITQNPTLATESLKNVD